MTELILIPMMDDLYRKENGAVVVLVILVLSSVFQAVEYYYDFFLAGFAAWESKIQYFTGLYSYLYEHVQKTALSHYCLALWQLSCEAHKNIKTV